MALLEAQWPEADATKLKSVAGKVNMTGAVTDILEKLKDLVFGDLDKLDEAARVCRTATTELTATKTDLTRIGTRVATFWRGDGATALQEWLRRYQESVDYAHSSLTAVSNALLEFRDVVVRQYAEAIRLVSRMLAAVIEALGNLSMNILDGFGTGKALAKVLSTLVREGGQIIANGVENSNSQVRAIRKAEDTVNKFAHPLIQINGNLGSPAAWQPKT